MWEMRSNKVAIILSGMPKSKHQFMNFSVHCETTFPFEDFKGIWEMRKDFRRFYFGCLKIRVARKIAADIRKRYFRG